jgi:type I site-specific restriction-modification system R (restriction) subunit
MPYGTVEPLKEALAPFAGHIISAFVFGSVAIGMDSYRPEVKATLSMAMDDADGTVEPAPPGGGDPGGTPDIDKLSNIIRTFNDLFGNIDWKDADKIRKVIAEDIPARVALDKAYQNAQQHSDKQNAKLEHDKALNRVVLERLSDHTELFKQFSDNPNFKRWLTDMVFDTTYRPGTVPPAASVGGADVSDTDFSARIESAVVLVNLTQDRSISRLIGADEAL